MRNSLLPWLWLALGLGACRSHSFGKIERDNALEHLDQAAAQIENGEFERALEHLAEVHEVSGLDPDLRAREERLIDQASRARFAELSTASADELEDLFRSKLPDRVRARAGILAAQRLLEDDRRIAAYRMVKKVDEELPRHHERVLAGDVVARTGLSLIHDERRYYLLFHYRPRGVQALEYLVLNYPLEPRCPEAYFALSEVYEAEGDLDQAIERSEDLLLYHSDSAYAVGAAARLPYLRLCRLQRDDFDRGELLRARGEFASWIARYPDHELRDWVEGLHAECLQRLTRNDLYLARYYERIESPTGQRLHAQRAQAQALEAGFEAEAAEARDLLAALPSTQAPPPPQLEEDLP